MPPKKEPMTKRKATAAQAPNKRVKIEPTTPKENEPANANAPVENSPIKSVMNLHSIPPVLPETTYIHPLITPPFADVQVIQLPLKKH